MSKTILCIDDSTTLRMSVEMTLFDAGYKVVHAVNGQDGLDKLAEFTRQKSSPCMIIVDINMPVMDGITFLEKARKTEFKYLPILVLTTERDDAVKIKGEKAGASAWLVKPFKPDTLLAVVRKFTRSL